MSTRATYVFKPSEKDYTRNVTWVYIHYDGYPEGAAVYFYNAIMADNQRGNMATVFIRSNELAEITDGHHGDTEYHYEIVGKGPNAKIIAKYIVYGNGSTPERKWRLFFDGFIRDFIDKNHGYIDDYAPFQLVKYGYSESWINQALARKRIEEKVSQLETWSKNGACSPGYGNWRVSMKDINEMTDVFPELAEEFRERLETVNVANYGL